MFVWCVLLQELRSAYSEEAMGSRREEEMEMSYEDLEEEAVKPCKRRRWSGENPQFYHMCSIPQPDRHPLADDTIRRACVCGWLLLCRR